MTRESVPLIVIVNSAVDQAAGLPDASKVLLAAACKTGLVASKCIQYVNSNDLAQLQWWYGKGARVFVGLDNLSGAGLFDFFNVRPDAIYLSARLCSTPGLQNVFSYARPATEAQVKAALDLATDSNDGLGEFAASGVLLSDGSSSTELFGSIVTPAYTYTLTNQAEADAILSDPAAISAIQHASAVMVGVNPPALLIEVLSQFQNVRLLTPFLNPLVNEAVWSNNGHVFFAQEVVGVQFDKLVFETFGRPVNAFVESLLFAVQTAGVLQGILERCVGSIDLRGALILSAQFDRATETLPAILFRVLFETYEVERPLLSRVPSRALPHVRK